VAAQRRLRPLDPSANRWSGEPADRIADEREKEVSRGRLYEDGRLFLPVSTGSRWVACSVKLASG
jgi:hypothetical protein